MDALGPRDLLVTQGERDHRLIALQQVLATTAAEAFEGPYLRPLIDQYRRGAGDTTALGPRSGISPRLGFRGAPWRAATGSTSGSI